MSNRVSAFIAAAAISGVAAGIYAAQRPPSPQASGSAKASADKSTSKQQAATTVEVFKSPTCGCCSKWVEHLQAAGFIVKATNVDDIYEVKTRHRVPAAVESCHTALVGGYVVEGHVPVADMQRLLKEKPAVAGIGVRGMPIGSPGMEVEGVRPQAYNVLAFDKQGQTRVFSKQNQ